PTRPRRGRASPPTPYLFSASPPAAHGHRHQRQRVSGRDPSSGRMMDVVDPTASPEVAPLDQSRRKKRSLSPGPSHGAPPTGLLFGDAAAVTTSTGAAAPPSSPGRSKMTRVGGLAKVMSPWASNRQPSTVAAAAPGPAPAPPTLVAGVEGGGGGGTGAGSGSSAFSLGTTQQHPQRNPTGGTVVTNGFTAAAAAASSTHNNNNNNNNNAGGFRFSAAPTAGVPTPPPTATTPNPPATAATTAMAMASSTSPFSTFDGTFRGTHATASGPGVGAQDGRQGAEA
ncbi:unnamed protein product, partial [Scytosiphon promiscuus]